MASSSSEAQPRHPWPAVRAGLITLALAVHGSMALPWPDLSPSDLQYRVAQDELRHWSSVLGELGVERSPEELRTQALALGRASTAAQRLLHGPFRPLLRLTGTGQSWGLFAYPDPYSGRLVVSKRRRAAPGTAAWELVYRAPGEGEPWLVELLEYRRVRGIYDDNGDRPRPGLFYERLCDLVAARIMEREVEVVEVELRLDAVSHRTPDDPRPVAPDKRRHVRTRTRADVAERLALHDALLPLEAGETGPAPTPFSPPVGP